MASQTTIYTQLINSKKYLPTAWQTQYQAFLQEEILAFFAQRIDILFRQGKVHQTPFFKEEIPQDYTATLQALTTILSTHTSDTPQQLAQLLIHTPFKDILLLMGQRITPASLQDHRAIPPLRHLLIQSCTQAYNKETSVGVRAWEKHVGRNPNSILGKIQGNQQQKETTLLNLVNHMLDHHTWWNVFGHYKHDYVYEIRMPNGQGIRWSKDGQRLIGFLENFLDNE